MGYPKYEYCVKEITFSHGSLLQGAKNSNKMHAKGGWRWKRQIQQTHNWSDPQQNPSPSHFLPRARKEFNLNKAWELFGTSRVTWTFWYRDKLPGCGILGSQFKFKSAPLSRISALHYTTSWRTYIHAYYISVIATHRMNYVYVYVEMIPLKYTRARFVNVHLPFTVAVMCRFLNGVPRTL